MKSEVVTVVNVKIAVFWNVTLCILEDNYQHSGGTCCHHLPAAKKLLLKHNLSKAEINPQLCKIQETTQPVIKTAMSRIYLDTK